MALTATPARVRKKRKKGRRSNGRLLEQGKHAGSIAARRCAAFFPQRNTKEGVRSIKAAESRAAAGKF